MPTIYVSNKDELPERVEVDFYPTPYELCFSTINYLSDTFMFDWENVKILDPGSGNGVWGKALRNKWETCELYGVEIRNIEKPKEYDYWYSEIDFISNDFQFSPYVKFDLIIGNPPYRYKEEFIDKSFTLLNKGGFLVFLLKLSFLESKTRYKKYFSTYKNPIMVLSSVRRVSFTGNKKSNADAYGVFIWKDGWYGLSMLDWLDWDYDK